MALTKELRRNPKEDKGKKTDLQKRWTSGGKLGFKIFSPNRLSVIDGGEILEVVPEIHFKLEALMVRFHLPRYVLPNFDAWHASNCKHHNTPGLSSHVEGIIYHDYRLIWVRSFLRGDESKLFSLSLLGSGSIRLDPILQINSGIPPDVAAINMDQRPLGPLNALPSMVDYDVRSDIIRLAAMSGMLRPTSPSLMDDQKQDPSVD